MSSVGIDIGSENSFIAVVKAGGIEVLDNEYSFRFTPSYLTFNKYSRDAGIAAKARVVADLENTVFGFKKLLGRKYDDPDICEELTYFPHPICELPSGNIGIAVSYLKNDVTFSVHQLMAMLFTKLKMLTETKLGNAIRECVISVPVYYSDAQRRAMLEVAYIAGLNVLKLMNESTAVALAYGFYKLDLPQDPRNVIFVDFGNSCITVTACAFSKDKFEVLACVWDDVGGRDFDIKLVEYFANDFKNRYQLDVLSNKKAVMALMLECELLKKKMSANPLEFGIQIECFMQDKDVTGRMKRELFENLSAPILSRVENTLQSIFDATGLKREDIHAVEIVGGSSRMPVVKSLIKTIFGREPNATLNLDEAVVRGCALQCALLSPSLKTKEFIIHDKPTYSIKIAWQNKESKTEELEVFSCNDKVPGFKLITVYMCKPFIIEAFYRSPFSSSKMNKIGTFTLVGIPQDLPIEYAEFKITACLNIHGIFSVTKARVIIRNEPEKMKMHDENEEIDVSAVNNSTSNTEESKKAVCVPYDLSVTSDVPEKSKSELTKYVEMEQQMIRTDIKQKEQADARNALEEFIYDVKAKLHYEYNAFVQEDIKMELLNYLDETENWLLDNEDPEVTEYSKKMTEAKNHFEPIILRYMEWEKRPFIISEFRQAHQKSVAALNDFPPQEKVMDIKQELDDLRKICDDSKNYLDQALDTFSKLKKYDDVPLKADELKKALEKFQNEFQTRYSKLLGKMESAQESAESSNGVGDLLE